MQYQETYELRCTYTTGDESVTPFDDADEAQAAYAKEARTIAKGETVKLVRVAEVTLASAVRAK